jgi:sugar phosphate isomerase/epimerase
MLRAMSTFVGVKQRLHPGFLDRLAQGGAQAIEIFGAKGHFDYTDRAHIREIAGWFKGNAVELNSLHAPMFSDAHWGDDGSPPVNITAVEKRERIDSMDEIKRAIAVAEMLPFRFLVQHIGTPNESFSDKKFDMAMTGIEHLRAFAKPLGVSILVENIPNELSTAEKILDLIAISHFTDVGVCFDVGHAHMMNNVPSDFEALKEHIRSTHVHDNGRDRDSHFWPGGGTIDWKNAMELLQSAPHTPPLLMEIEGIEGQNVATEMAKAYAKLEQAVEV